MVGFQGAGAFAHKSGTGMFRSCSFHDLLEVGTVGSRCVAMRRAAVRHLLVLS